jgi:hypothetical protein
VLGRLGCWGGYLPVVSITMHDQKSHFVALCSGCWSDSYRRSSHVATGVNCLPMGKKTDTAVEAANGTRPASRLPRVVILLVLLMSLGSVAIAVLLSRYYGLNSD